MITYKNITNNLIKKRSPGAVVCVSTNQFRSAMVSASTNQFRRNFIRYCFLPSALVCVPTNQFRTNFIRYCFLLIAIFTIVSCNSNSNKPVSKNKEEAVRNNPADSSAKKKTILFFGNSLTAGYGVDPSEAYPALIQDKIDSLHLNYKVINAGVSGETTADGNSRIGWILKQPVDIFVLELGGNDGLRGIPLYVTEKNLQTIIDKVRTKYPQVKIILEGIQIPPNMGSNYTAKFKEIYPLLASKNKIQLLPFLLKGVGGDPKLNQRDGIHPTAEGHKIVAENVWQVLKGDL